MMARRSPRWGSALMRTKNTFWTTRRYEARQIAWRVKLFLRDCEARVGGMKLEKLYGVRPRGLARAKHREPGIGSACRERSLVVRSHFFGAERCISGRYKMADSQRKFRQMAKQRRRLQCDISNEKLRAESNMGNSCYAQTRYRDGQPVTLVGFVVG